MLKRPCKTVLLGGALRSRLILLLVIAGAFLLASVAQAFASPTATVKITGNGSGEILGVAPPFEGTPPIVCSYNGSITSGVCNTVPHEIEEGEPFYGLGVEAHPASGSELVGWTVQKGTALGSNCGKPATPDLCFIGSAVEGEEQLEVTATLALEPALQVVQSGSGSGTVECKVGGGVLGPCPANVAKGSVVKVVVTPAAGSELAAFSGSGSAVGCSSSPCEFAITESSTLNAKFTGDGLAVYLGGTAEGSVTSTLPDNGIDCGGKCSSLYTDGTVITLEAHPSAGAVFAGWIGCRHLSATTCEVTVVGETEVTAVFVKNGVEGKQGSTGPTGTTGATGAQGSQGLKGSAGSQGLQGVQGVAGAQGASGEKGAAGAQGSAGANGAQGAQGPMGPQGPAGPAGKVSCKIKGKKVTCTVKYAASKARVSRWSLTRKGRVYSHGLTAGGQLRLSLRRLPAGRYRLRVAGDERGALIVVR